MTDIYFEISKLSGKFRQMCYGLTKDKNEVDELVQELMLYFLQMNTEVLKKIWIKDGKKGILKYGAVALRRAFTSPRSNYYYKYKKYYSHIDASIYTNACSTSDDCLSFDRYVNKSLQNIPNEEMNYQWNKLEEIDKALDDCIWYERKIFELYYYESNTLDSLAKKTKISRNSLFSTIDKVRNIIKEKVNEEN
tara:strand:+ start:104 stop:682 length:579 start_codon:yes stop_codon:yes gene_type:complete